MMTDTTITTKQQVNFILNNSPVSWEGNLSARLLDVLRDDFNCIGVKCGCREGECGACSVLIDGTLVNSCLVAMAAVAGCTVTSIEGYRETERFAVLDEAYAKFGAVQCGYCSPGMILASEALLANNPTPNASDIRTALSGNLCRCTGYNAIISSVLDAAASGIWSKPGQTALAGSPAAGNQTLPATDAPAQAGSVGGHVSVKPATITLSAALQTLAATTMVPYAGGTDLMVEANPSNDYLYIGNIDDLKTITESDDNIYIGAACSFSQLLSDSRTPAILRDAIAQIAAPGIRNVATIGGNIANASPKADSALVLFAADASVRLLRMANGRIAGRTIPISEFILDRGKTSLQPDELLCEIIIPKAYLGNYYYQKVGARNALAISRLSFAGLISVQNDVIDHIAVAFGAVANTVIRRPDIDAMLIGMTLAQARAAKAEYLSVWESEIVPVAGRVSAQYRKSVCRNLLKDFLEQNGI